MGSFSIHRATIKRACSRRSPSWQKRNMRSKPSAQSCARRGRGPAPHGGKKAGRAASGNRVSGERYLPAGAGTVFAAQRQRRGKAESSFRAAGGRAGGAGKNHRAEAGAAGAGGRAGAAAFAATGRHCGASHDDCGKARGKKRRRTDHLPDAGAARGDAGRPGAEASADRLVPQCRSKQPSRTLPRSTRR